MDRKLSANEIYTSICVDNKKAMQIDAKEFMEKRLNEFDLSKDHVIVNGSLIGKEEDESSKKKLIFDIQMIQPMRERKPVNHLSINASIESKNSKESESSSAITNESIKSSTLLMSQNNTKFNRPDQMEQNKLTLSQLKHFNI